MDPLGHAPVRQAERLWACVTSTRNFSPPTMFLKSFMKRPPMNALFPVSIVLGTWITAILVAHAGEAQTRFQSVGLTFLITMLALGVIEHWFLVLPLPFARIWGWWLQQQGRTPTHAIVHEHRPHACSGDQDPQPAVA